MRTLGLFLIGLLSGAGVMAGGNGCNTYDTPLLDGEPIERPPIKTGIGWWSKNDSRGCFSAGMPRPEDRPKPGSDKDVGPILLAISSMRLGSLNEQGAVMAGHWPRSRIPKTGPDAGADASTATDAAADASDGGP